MEKKPKVERKKTNGIPYLKLDRSRIDGNHTSTKLNTNGKIMNRLKPLIGELKKQTRFPNTCNNKEKPKLGVRIRDPIGKKEKG